MKQLPRVVFSVDGAPVDLADWSCSSSADLGFDQFRASATTTRAKKVVGGLDQGSVVKAYTESGGLVWEGTISQPPTLGQDGIAQVAAQGYGYRSAKSGNRVTPIIDAPGAWIQPDLDPIKWPTGGYASDPTVTNSLTTRRITFLAATSGANCGFAFAARGMNITRFSATLASPFSGAVWRLITARLPNVVKTAHIEAAGLSGATTVTGMGTPGIGRRFQANVAFDPCDVVIIELYANTANGTLSSASQKTIDNPVVQGDYDSTVIYTHHAAKIIGHQLGWDVSGVTGKGGAPLTASDWAGDGLTYMGAIAGLEDYCWGVWEDQGYGPYMTFGPYGRRVWEVSAATGAMWDLEPLERVRRVTVQYLNVDLSLGEVTLEAPDDAQLSASVDTELKGSLNDAQTNTNLAAMTAFRTLQRFLQARYRGRVLFAHAFEEGSRRDAAYEVRAGDLIKITDFSLDGSITLRIADVEYGPSGVTVGIEAPALPLGGSVRGTATVTPIAVASTTNGTAVYVPPGTSAGGGGEGVIEPGPIKTGGGISGGGGYQTVPWVK